MSYNPSPDTVDVLDAAWDAVQSVPYNVTARWVFYRLLQDGILDKKSDYKRLLGYLSKARKNFHGGWTPSTLADETRAAQVRGGGYDDAAHWLRDVASNERCILDHWATQPDYLEIWFEASAMQAQFRHYAHRHIPLLAFRGDISIPEKWKAAVRLADRWLEGKRLVVENRRIRVMYYGDLDPKGMQIPESAFRDVLDFAMHYIDEESSFYEAVEFDDAFVFKRIGLNPGQPREYEIPENPERPGTYQWEALGDDDARELIEEANEYLDFDAFHDVDSLQVAATTKFREHALKLEL